MNEDAFEAEILDGGAIKIKISKTSPSFRASTQEFIQALCKDSIGDVAVARLTTARQAANTEPERPRLDFFDDMPANAGAHPPLVSSLQSLETCFSLVALERYPQALIVCAGAIESTLKAKLECMLRLKLKLGKREHLECWQLVDEAKFQSRKLANFELGRFLKARNRFIHHGFSPRDDEEAVRLLLETGIPFINECYKEFYDFYLDYRDLPQNWPRAEKEICKFAFPQRTADQLRVAFEVYTKAKDSCATSVKYCISTFAQYIGFLLRSAYMFSDSEHPDSHFGKITVGVDRERMKEAVLSLWQVPLDTCIEFDCPICCGSQTLVARLDEKRLKNKILSVDEAMCVKCGMAIPKGRPFLADTFLKDQLSERKDEILQKFGRNELGT